MSRRIPPWKDCWIWGRDSQSPSQYMQFLHRFDAGQGDGFTLEISADTNYACWLNGRFISFGQYADFPEHKFYDTIDIGKYVRKGENTLAVLAYYCGTDTSTYARGVPMVAFLVKEGDKTAAISSGETLCRPAKGYRQGEMELVTPQMGYPFFYDAREDDGWNTPDYRPGDGWEPACPVVPALLEDMEPRPVDKLPILPPCTARIQAQGLFFRTGRGKTLAEQFYYDYLSPLERKELFANDRVVSLPCKEGLVLKKAAVPEGQGIYLELDLGREEAGLLSLELDAPAGTAVEIGYGQHLEDLRVWSYVGGRNFVHRYLCREGRQSFVQYFQRLGGRYLELRVSGMTGDVTLYTATLLPNDYPVEEKGRFSASDSLHEKICEVGKRTLHLCMHEHYEDTPWREQALYAMDSRNQALCGYYCFGEYKFPQASFSLFVDNYPQEGYTRLCAPSHNKGTIPYFSYMWVVACGECVLYSGNMEFAQRVWPGVKSCMEQFFARLDDKGLMSYHPDGKYWNFYEWAQGLDGWAEEEDAPERLDAPLSLFFAMALEKAAFLAGCVGEGEFASLCLEKRKRLMESFHAVFWDEEKGLYQTYQNSGKEKLQGHYSQLVQALALVTGACPEELRKGLRDRLLEDDEALVPVTISHSIYKYEALLLGGEAYAGRVLDEIHERWGRMIFAGTTTFWETDDSLSPFKRGYSLCHGWTAVPVYLYYAYILGIKPASPGFRTFTASPLCGSLECVEGEVPTPFGAIHIRKERGKELPELSYPEEISLINRK